MAEDRVGQQLGNYRIIQRLGEGGFAEVYLGEHLYLKTQAAIKVLHTRLAHDDLSVFTSEAQTIARLKHPHIVRVLEFGVEGSTPFLVMDYAPGGTLRQRHPKGSRLDPAIILPYVKQVAEALHYAHEQKVVHRDVKPENMLLGERNEVLLSDFGIATVAQSSRYQGTQEVAGTVAYMAPEQVQGKPRPASDQYALGIVVYEWLTGERPFHGSFTEIATQHVLTPPPPLHEKLPTIAPAIEDVVLTALAKDSKERFASVQAFANAFEQACQVTSSQEMPTSAQQTQAVSDATTPPARPFEPSVLSTPTHITPESPAALASRSPATQAMPPGWQERASAPTSADPLGVLPPAPTLPPTVRATAPPVKPATRPRGRFSRRMRLVGSLILVLVLAAAGGVWALVWTPSAFHQEIMLSAHITSLEVGSGFNTLSDTLGDAKDTFKAGEQVYIVLHTSASVSSGEVGLLLFHDNALLETHLPFTTRATNVFWAVTATAITDTGIYKWEVHYRGTPEASITFQVIT